MKLAPLIRDLRESKEPDDSEWLLEVSLAIRVWSTQTRGAVIPEDEIAALCQTLGGLALVVAFELGPKP